MNSIEAIEANLIEKEKKENLLAQGNISVTNIF